MTFTPTTMETVDAARAAVAAAERVRSAECEERRNRCRERETQEQAKRDALTAILQAKAATDQAAQLDAEAAAIRARLAVAAPVRETNPLGAALGRLLAVSAVTAATWQQAIVSGIVELLIAAALALPELLRQSRPEARQESDAVPEVSAPPQTAEPAQESARRQRVIGGVALVELPKPAEVGSVVEFMLACLPRKRGRDAPVTAIYARYVRWCAEHQPPLRPLEPATFAEQFKALCERAGVETDRRGRKVYCLDVQLVA
jgi:hypothetical protein